MYIIGFHEILSLHAFKTKNVNFKIRVSVRLNIFILKCIIRLGGWEKNVVWQIQRMRETGRIKNQINRY